MKRKRKLFFNLFFILILSILSSCTTYKNDKPVKIIFDTDIGNDIDDVLALQMLLNYHKVDALDLLGITISKSNPYTIPYIDGFCRYNNIENIPIGYVYEGPNTNNGRYLKQTLDTLINDSPILEPQLTIRDNLLDAWELQRKILSQQEDSSVVMVAVGPLTNLYRLLVSSSDQYSPLNGLDLISKKVRLLSVMGGVYSDSLQLAEWNIAQDIESAMVVFNEWPGKIVTSGWEVGNELLYPSSSISNNFKNSNPLYISYSLWDQMPYDRPSWDLTSVLYAVEHNAGYFNLSDKGKVVVNEFGESHFISGLGNHHFLKIQSTQLDNTLKTLIDRVTDIK